MKRVLALCLTLLLACGAAGAEGFDPFSWYEDEDMAQAFSAHCRLEGDALVILEGVTVIGEYIGDWMEDPDDPDDDILVENEEEEALFEDTIYFGYWESPDFSRVIFPSSLRRIGCEAFAGYHFREFTLPSSLEKVYWDAFVNCTFDTLRIEAALPYEQIRNSMYDCSVYAFDGPEDHPLYKTVDGVLLSRDGKTLLRYPASRKDTHYDVPAGVERIESRAFQDAEALKTISLPIGLASVGDYAFSGCGRLQAVALPLTVKEIGKNPFDECVSLELVSAPEGLSVGKDTDSSWVIYYADDALFRGDNGDTRTGGGDEEDAWWWLWEPGRLIGDEERVPLYAEAGAARPFASAVAGTIVSVRVVGGSWAMVGNPLSSGQQMGWVDISRVRLLRGDTLFAYAKTTVPAGTEIWTEGLPAPVTDGKGVPAERAYTTESPLPYGPFLKVNDDEDWWIACACRIQDAALTRQPDGTDHVYGVLYSENAYEPVPLLDGAGGQTVEEMTGGTQVMILAEEENGYRVTTVFTEGWVSKDHVKIVPEYKEGN